MSTRQTWLLEVIMPATRLMERVVIDCVLNILTHINNMHNCCEILMMMVIYGDDDGKMVMVMMEIDYLWFVEKGVVGGTDLRLLDHRGAVFGDHLSVVSVLHTS